jgi:hypothetical protein
MLPVVQLLEVTGAARRHAGCVGVDSCLSMWHQALVALFRNRPTLATELLSQELGAPVPVFRDVRFESPVLEDVVLC